MMRNDFNITSLIACIPHKHIVTIIHIAVDDFESFKSPRILRSNKVVGVRRCNL